MLVQLKVGLADTPVAPFAGEETEGVPGAVQGAEPVVKLHTDPVVEPQLFFPTIFQ